MGHNNDGESYDDSVEDAFMRGYEEDDASPCLECGAMVDSDLALKKEIEGENRVFCSKDCVNDYLDH